MSDCLFLIGLVNILAAILDHKTPHKWSTYYLVGMVCLVAAITIKAVAA